MTGDAPVPSRSALWAALSHLQIEEPGTARRLEEVLAAEQGWSVGFAERVTGEYRRFLFLAATAGFEATPSRSVDEAWHIHLRWPHYREVLCGQILGRPLEHRSATGATGATGEQQRHRRQYERTVALYERAFLRPPPSDVWPAWIFEADREAEDSRRRNRKLARGGAAGAALGAVASYPLGYPLTALLLAALAATLAVLAYRLFPRKARRRAGSCDEGFEFETGGGDGPDGGASCGGGSCGGGGD